MRGRVKTQILGKQIVFSVLRNTKPDRGTDRIGCRNSYYLSSHHIDICCWILQGKAVPTRVTASAAAGIATGEPYNCVPQTEDTITLLVDWQSLTSPRHRGTAVYTASWTAPQNSGVHTAQHFYYMAEKVCIPPHPPPPVSNLTRTAEPLHVSG